ncbi:MAG: hypothetical protein O2923_06050 [Verrucomicrobia bacterium]|nr:hypothetical protein [Verrucomicrobiota bacterium]MDA1087501.1 hypothetical protein [Verrucomicrobiota bacterium]
MRRSVPFGYDVPQFAGVDEPLQLGLHGRDFLRVEKPLQDEVSVPVELIHLLGRKVHATQIGFGHA